MRLYHMRHLKIYVVINQLAGNDSNLPFNLQTNGFWMWPPRLPPQNSRSQNITIRVGFHMQVAKTQAYPVMYPFLLCHTTWSQFTNA